MNTTTTAATTNNNLESYPLPFRLRKTPPADGDDLTESTKQDCPIPIIDFQCLIRDNKEEDYKNCDDKKKKLVEACRDWGVFRLVNHGVPPDLLNKVQDFAREIFSLPFETKQGLFTTTPLSYFWGTPALTPSGAALSSSPQNINWVEGLNVPLTQLSQLQLQPQPHDQHPSLISFRLLLEEYGRHLGRLATAIFEAMSKELKMDITDESSKPHLSESTGFIRVYRYPPYSDEEEEEEEEEGGEHTAWGMDVHTDSSVLSILNQDQVGGLEVLKDDQWFTVEPVSNTLVVNLGDMMQAMSNDEYKSVKHRVKVNRYKERVSICYFVFPGEGSVIKSSKYKPFTYSDFRAQVQQDIKSLGYKVGLERFKITSTTNTITEAC